MTGTRYRVSWSPDWTDRGTCASDPDPDRWHPRDGDVETADAARAVCRACPVMEACQEYAIATGQPHGIWGALDTNQRRKVARDRARREASRPAAAEPSQPAAEVAA